MTFIHSQTQSNQSGHTDSSLPLPQLQPFTVIVFLLRPPLRPLSWLPTARCICACVTFKCFFFVCFFFSCHHPLTPFAPSSQFPSKGPILSDKSLRASQHQRCSAGCFEVGILQGINHHQVSMGVQLCLSMCACAYRQPVHTPDVPGQPCVPIVCLLLVR